MPNKLVGQNEDFQQHQILNVVAQNLGADPGSPVVGQFWFRTDLDAWRVKLSGSIISLGAGGGGLSNAYSTITDGTTPANASGGDTFKLRSGNNILAVVTANNDATHGDNALFTVTEGNITHNNISGLTTGDGHTQYVHISTARTITAQHSFSPGSTQAPFLLGANAQGQLVTGLNADLHDGFNTATTRPGNSSVSVVTAAADGKIDSSFLTEKIASTDLTDVTTTVGTGALVFQSYVDASLEGRDDKASVRLATTAALPTNTRSGNVLTASANGALTVDGTAVALNDEILVKNEATGANNGVYKQTVLGTGGVPFQLTRRADADSSADVTAGLTVFVSEGTANGNTGWTLITDDAITLNTTALVFTQTFGLGAFSVSNVSTGGAIGIIDSTSGSVFQFRGVIATSNKIAVTLDGTNKAASIDVTEANLTLQNLGGLLTVAKGGTNSTTASGARTNLGAVGKYSALFGNGALTTWTITQATHGLAAARSNIVQVQLESTGEVVDTAVSVASNGDVTVDYSPAPTTNNLRITIIG